jgi:acyl-CoA oxidase
MQLVAKGKLTEYKQTFHSDGFRAVLTHLYTKLSNTLSTLNPIETRNTNYKHLTDRAFHLHAFKFRETKLLVSLSDRMRSLLSKRVDPYQAFLKCQNHMVVLAHAYVERVVLKAFVSKINQTSDQETKQILIKLCDLYALSTIERRKDWYLENDYLEGSKSKAIRRLIDKQCRIITSDAISLVEAFDIPEELIAAQIVIQD